MYFTGKKYKRVLFPPALLLMFGAAHTSTEYRTHTVREGESVSLICIDLYGYYCTELGRAVAGDNPSIEDINAIFPGQKIRFRKPEMGVRAVAAETEGIKKTAHESVSVASSDSVKDTVSATEASVFIRKMHAVQGVVTCVEGSASVRQSVSGRQKKLRVNTVVTPGDIITTGKNGRIELIINREAVVRLKENSEMVLEAFRVSDKTDKKTKVRCPGGGIWTKVKKFRDRFSRFELELPTAIAGVHGTVYETIVAPDSTSIKVFSGEVAVRNAGEKLSKSPPAGLHQIDGPHEVTPPHEVSMEQWTRIVHSMQKIIVDKNGVPTPPAAFTESRSSSWEQWNKKRDQRIAMMFGE